MDDNDNTHQLTDQLAPDTAAVTFSQLVNASMYNGVV